jgi:cellulose synthase/poly-beta-1,6-N-acetylglucosamine synthase-like glycosyltransferase
LYPTANDFEHRALLSCVAQRYPNFHVFILDDSSRDEYRTQVDAFHREFPQGTTVVRRESHEGFKAGNINNALGVISSDYELFAICDSDNVLAPDFLAQLTPYFQEDTWLGFAQASHRSNGLREDSFIRDMESLANVRWEYHNLPRNRYGLPFCLGHGVVLRTEAWKQAGQFPFMVSEDIGLTFSMRRQGYYGRFVPDVICGEGIPPSLPAWRKAHFRMVTADLECLFKSVIPFVGFKGVTLVEKVDAVARTLQIPLSALFLPFLLASAFLLPSLPDESSAVTGWQFLLLNLLVALSGYVRFLVDLFPRMATAIRFISQMTALQLSLLLTTALGLLTFSLTRRAHFFVTAAAAGDRPGRDTNFLSSLARLNPNHPAVLAMGALLALLLAFLAVVTLNLVVLAVSLSVFIMLLLHRLGWDWLPGRVLVHVPALLFLLGALSDLAGIPGPPGQVLVLAALSVLVYS